jgi:hypothetical protein
MTKNKIFTMIQTFGLYGIEPHEEFMKQVEPYVLRSMEEFNPEEIAYLFTNYCKMRFGSEIWIKLLINATQNVAKWLTLEALIQVLLSLK